MLTKKEDFKQFTWILIAVVLSGFISLFILKLYEENNQILMQPKLSIVFVILIQAITYLIPIAVVLFLVWLFFKLADHMLALINDSFNRGTNFILKKLKLEKIKNIDIKFDFSKVYKRHKELINFIFLCIISYYLFSNRDTIIKTIKLSMFIIGQIFLVYSALIRLFLYIKSFLKKGKNKANKL